MTVRKLQFGVRKLQLGVRKLQLGVRKLQFGEDGGMETPEQPERQGQGQQGLAAVRTFTVVEEDTAVAVGSGSLPVLGTPRLLAWCEAVTCEAIEPLLAVGRTSVGTRVSLEHLAASKVGAEVEVSASAVYTEPKLVRFIVSARMGTKLVGSGEVTRVVVDTERFLARLG